MNNRRIREFFGLNLEFPIERGEHGELRRFPTIPLHIFWTEFSHFASNALRDASQIWEDMNRLAVPAEHSKLFEKAWRDITTTLTHIDFDQRRPESKDFLLANEDFKTLQIYLKRVAEIVHVYLRNVQDQLSETFYRVPEEWTPEESDAARNLAKWGNISRNLQYYQVGVAKVAEHFQQQFQGRGKS